MILKFKKIKSYFLFQNLRGGALLITLTFSLVILVILSSLLLLGYYKRLEFEKNVTLSRLQNNLISAIHIGLKLEPNESNIQSLDLYDNGNDSVQFSIKQWGVFEIIAAQATSSHTTLQKNAIIGYKPDKNQLSSLYIADLNRPISVCGDTKINGTCYLPEAGVKRAYIEGQSYNGSELIYGTTKKSNPSLPELNKNIINNLKELLAGKYTQGTELIGFDTLKTDSLHKGFTENTLCLFSSNAINLSNKKLTGNIIISSTNRIFVNKNSYLRDIILVAPEIIIEDNFEGNMQMIADDSLEIGKGCKLKYPSASLLIANDADKKSKILKLKEEAEFEGLLCIINENTASYPLISLDKKTLVKGIVYSTGFVETKGKVWGNITTQKLLLLTNSSVYENHLLNTEVDVNKLSKHFVGSSLIYSQKQKSIIKWL